MAQRYVNKIFGDLETIKWRHILEITSYYHCDVKLPQLQHSFPRSWYVRFIQVTSTVQFHLEDVEFITKLNKQNFIKFW